MKLAIIISQNNAEATFNALRLANYALKEGDEVKVFLVAEGVELDQIVSEKFNVKAQVEAFLADGGVIMACGTCLKIRNSNGSELCPLSTMKDLYELVKESDKVVTF